MFEWMYPLAKEMNRNQVCSVPWRWHVNRLTYTRTDSNNREVVSLLSPPTIECSGNVNVARMESICWMCLCNWSLLGLLSVCAKSLSLPSSDSWRMFPTNWSKDVISSEYLKWNNVFFPLIFLQREVGWWTNKQIDQVLGLEWIVDSEKRYRQSRQRFSWRSVLTAVKVEALPADEAKPARDREKCVTWEKQKHCFTCDWLSYLIRRIPWLSTTKQSRGLILSTIDGSLALMNTTTKLLSFQAAIPTNERTRKRPIESPSSGSYQNQKRRGEHFDMNRV